MFFFNYLVLYTVYIFSVYLVHIFRVYFVYSWIFSVNMSKCVCVMLHPSFLQYVRGHDKISMLNDKCKWDEKRKVHVKISIQHDRTDILNEKNKHKKSRKILLRISRQDKNQNKHDKTCLLNDKYNRTERQSNIQDNKIGISKNKYKHDKNRKIYVKLVYSMTKQAY